MEAMDVQANRVGQFGRMMGIVALLLIVTVVALLMTLWVSPVPMAFIFYTAMDGVACSALFIFLSVRRAPSVAFLICAVFGWGAHLVTDLSLPPSYIEQHKVMLILQSLCIILAVLFASVLLFRTGIKRSLIGQG